MRTMRTAFCDSALAVSLPWGAALLCSFAYRAAQGRQVHGVGGAVSSACYLAAWAAYLFPGWEWTPASERGATSALVCHASSMLVFVSAKAHLGGRKYWEWDHGDREAYNGVGGNDVLNYDVLAMVGLTTSVLALSVALFCESDGAGLGAASAFGVAGQVILLHDDSVPPKHDEVRSGALVVSLFVCIGLFSAASFFRRKGREGAVELAVPFAAASLSTVSYQLADACDWGPGGYPAHDAASVTFHACTAIAVCTLLRVVEERGKEERGDPHAARAVEVEGGRRWKAACSVLLLLLASYGAALPACGSTFCEVPTFLGVAGIAFCARKQSQARKVLPSA